MFATRIPKYRKHRGSGQAVVTINGRDYYLGVHGTTVSKRNYDQLIAEYLSTGHVCHNNGLTVTELISLYWKYVKSYYVKDGEPTTEVERMRIALRALRKLYGNIPAREFSPLKLKTVREQFVETGICRTSVNKQVERIRRMYRWAVAEELIPPDVIHGLTAVQGLRKGRSSAPELPPVKPIDEKVVEATLPHLPSVVSDIARFQLVTGCRPQEACRIRPMDIDRSEKVWIYRPGSHKTEHHDRNRVIPLGPRAQAIITPYLDREPYEYLFSPNESERLRRLDAGRKRKTPLSCGNRRGTNRKKQPKRSAGQYYTTNVYARAIARACKKAKVEHWSPNRLRHTAATKIRREYGLEAAQIILGHANADVTQVYAERDIQKAIAVAEEIG